MNDINIESVNHLRDCIPEHMKTKNYIILSLFCLSALVVLWLMNAPTPNIHTIVATTHRTLHKLQPSNLHIREHRNLDVDEGYLDYLGFTETPSLYPVNKPRNAKLPVIASAVYSSNYDYSKDFLLGIRDHLPQNKIMVFDIGLSNSDNDELTKTCNKTIQCTVVKFNFDKFPYHVRHLGIKAYKPLAIQQVLNDFGGVIWADIKEDGDFLISSDISKIIKQAEGVGLTAWTIHEPTSALTHPKMFSYFKSKRENYFFHRMISTEHLVMYNIKKLHRDIMLPWVQCALIEECIRPTGSQDVGCNPFRKPLFRYSGCHHYEMSALNVILGQVFNYDWKDYTTSATIFGDPKSNGSTPAPKIYQY